MGWMHSKPSASQYSHNNNEELHRSRNKMMMSNTMTSSLPSDDVTHLKLNIFGFTLSPKPSSRKSSRDELKESGSKSPRSPFNIRRVRQVKPQKLVVGEKSSKKKKRKVTAADNNTMTSEQGSESRMVIRRDRTRSSIGQRQSTITDPRNADVFERLLRKKYSAPSAPERMNAHEASDDSENEIEKRRRRFRINMMQQQNPPKVKTNFRSLSLATQNILAKKLGDDINNNNDTKEKSLKENEDENSVNITSSLTNKNQSEHSSSEQLNNHKELSQDDVFSDTNQVVNLESEAKHDTIQTNVSPTNNDKQTKSHTPEPQHFEIDENYELARSSPVMNDRSQSQELRSSRDKRKDWKNSHPRSSSFTTDPLLPGSDQSDASDSEISDMNRGAGRRNKQTSHQKKKHHQSEKSKEKDEHLSSKHESSNNKSKVDTFSGKAENKNVLNLTVDTHHKNKGGDMMEQLSTAGGMDLLNTSARPKRSQSLKDKSMAVPRDIQRKSSHQPIKSFDLNDSLPDLIDTPKTPNNSADRLKRDYHLTSTEIMALRGIIKKADLYEETVRDRMFQVLKIDESKEDDIEKVVSKAVAEKEISSLKQKLFMSRKELDSYISFTKKMEREKRQSISEKEELETKIQWHERRLNRFETENKSLKTERATLLNQIYELKGKTSTMSQSGHMRQKSLDASLLNRQPELEISKQRLIYEADAFAQERTKLIKERQRLDEEVRKVQIRCVSLLAQLQHSEKTIEELKVEKEQLKSKLAKQSKQSHEDTMKLQTRLADVEVQLNQTDDETIEYRNKQRKEYSSFIETIRQDDNEFVVLQNDFVELERKYDALQNEYRNTEENRIRLDHENMALKDTVNVIQNAKEETLSRLNEMDVKYRETLGELKSIMVASEDFEKERSYLRQELEDVSSRLSELQHDAVEMEVDQDAFRKFLDKLTMELQEKLGEQHEDTEADTLEERAELIGKQVLANLNPVRKLADDYQALKEDKDDLEEEVRYLKFALANRLEIKNMQAPTQQKCECSKEKNAMKTELDDALSRIESLDAEVNRLHQDKQQLLMSFLNLQASQRSREVSKSDVGMTTDDDLSDDDEDDGDETETERESDGDDGDSRSYKSSNPSIGSSHNIACASSHTNNEDEMNDLRARLDDLIDAKERLEGERVEMLDSLCKQVESNNALKAELDELRGNAGSSTSRPNSRPGSSISKSDSSTSLSQEKCPNCQTYNDEIRSYLSIIEELTEDKLRLEKNLNDLESDREQLNADVERLTDVNCKMESELENVGSVNDSAIKAAKEESQFLLQNIQSLEHENSVLEENLRKLREDKTEILDNLRQAEEDRFGFIRTLQMVTEQKEVVELEAERVKEELERLKQTIVENANSNSSTYPALSKDTQRDGENDGDKSKMMLGRSYSTPVPHLQNMEFNRTNSASLESPKEHPLHRVSSVEDVSEDMEEGLHNELLFLREQLSSYKHENLKLQNSLDVANSLLNTNDKQREIINENCRAVGVSDLQNENKDVITSLERRTSDLDKRRSDFRKSTSIESTASDTDAPEKRRRGTLERKSSVVLDEESTPHQKLYQRRTSIDMSVLFDSSSNNMEEKHSTPTAAANAKTLSFTVSMNGIPVHEQNEF